ncbi:MAG: helix-turn-helix domain-containing protein [Terriglobia bacterium]
MAYHLMGVFEQAVKALEENPRRGLGDISAAVGVERHTLERAFQSNAGKSFREFRRELQVEGSIDLLRHSPAASLKQIAFLLGYESERAFARFIRTSFGCCPCEVRKQLANSGQPPGEASARKLHSSKRPMQPSGQFVPPGC